MSGLDGASVILAVGLPLGLAAALLVPAVREASAELASWVAALPALLLAIRRPHGAAVEHESLLLGTRLYQADDLTWGFLLPAALLWTAAARLASAYLAGSPHRASFWFFFLMTMAGNIGVVLADDVATLYATYALMTFAAYGLVLHERTDEARRAGRVYIVLALTGEVLLLAAFWLIAGKRIDLPLEEVPRAVAAAPERSVIVALLLAGFGVKAGVIPLHGWLPLAHPVAPTPASAILSGALINAGLLGWLRCLPLGLTAHPTTGTLVVVSGLVTIFYAAAIGSMQREPKTVLAYSSISQMGFMAAVLGAALVAPTAASAAVAGLVVFAAHHAIAKGALFLGTAVVREPWSVAARRVIRGGMIVPAAAIAGAPFTSGATAK